MSLRFDGLNDEVRTALGACDVDGGPIFICAVIKLNALGSQQSIVSLHNSLGDSLVAFEVNSFSRLLFVTSSGSRSMNSTIDSTWFFVAVGHASGSVVRFHTLRYSTGIWVHEQIAGNLADGSAPGAGGTVRFGERSDTDDFEGEIQAVAIYDNIHGGAFSVENAHVETMAYSLEAWFPSGTGLMLNPIGMWLFDEPSQLLRDITGNGADENFRQGTSAPTAISAPISGFGSPIRVIRPAAAVVAVTGAERQEGSLGILTRRKPRAVPI